MSGDKIGRNYYSGVLNRNFVKTVLEAGGSIVPLMINAEDSKGLGLCNPSIYIDNGRLLMILRNVNYTLYHAENKQAFNNRYGPLSYLNPENDIHLRTWNFLCELDPKTLAIIKYWKIDTSKLDVAPLWEFIGLEDARLVWWNGSLYGIGVRRDTTTNGQGRMELSQIVLNNTEVKEINRFRIEPPNDKESYCEKNWMPVLDRPYTFVKWTNPTEVVEVDIKTLTSKTIFLSKETIQGIPDLRGGSQVLNWNSFRIALVHDVNLFKNKMGQKNATYMHRFVVWDRDWNIVTISDPFSFMDGEIEFSCGMAFYHNDLLITFGFQDNAAFILRIPGEVLIDMLMLKKFSWGDVDKCMDFKNWLYKEIFQDRIYEPFFKVEEGDIVFDIGASVGPFTYSILSSNPSKVFCYEPQGELYQTLVANVGWHDAVVCYNLAVTNKTGINPIETLYDIESGSFIRTPIECTTISFMDTVKEIDHIDFLKIDCEGAEYEIFDPESYEWIKNNVYKIAGELHITTPEMKKQFVKFRDEFFKEFPQVKIISVDGIDITWDLWNDHFYEYYSCAMFYIDNRK